MAQKTRPGNAERGWNDPPEFLHNPGSGPPPPSGKRTILNKRVAYPGLQSGTGTSPPGGPCTEASPTPGVPPRPPTGPAPLPPTTSTTTNAALTDGAALSASAMTNSPPTGGIVLFPPASSTDIPKFNAPIIVPTMSPLQDSPLATIATIATNPINNQQVNMGQGCTELEIPDFESDEQMYHFVLTRLKKTCVDCAKILKPRVVDDVNRKIDIFSDMWKNAKISYPVKSSMARLATALHRRKCDIAHEIHLGLMMDYVSEVGQWMVGIKRLIHEARAIEAPLSPTENTSDVPVLEVTTGAQSSETSARLGLSDGINTGEAADTEQPVNNHGENREESTTDQNLHSQSQTEQNTVENLHGEAQSEQNTETGSEVQNQDNAETNTEEAGTEPESSTDTETSQSAETGPAVIDTSPITD